MAQINIEDFTISLLFNYTLPLSIDKVNVHPVIRMWKSIFLSSFRIHSDGLRIFFYFSNRINVSKVGISVGNQIKRHANPMEEKQYF